MNGTSVQITEHLQGRKMEIHERNTPAFSDRRPENFKYYMGIFDIFIAKHVHFSNFGQFLEVKIDENCAHMHSKGILSIHIAPIGRKRSSEVLVHERNICPNN